MKRIYSLCLLFIAVGLFSINIDSIRQLYNEGRWNELIKQGKLLIAKNISKDKMKDEGSLYYYMAIAYYKIGSYYKSARLFQLLSLFKIKPPYNICYDIANIGEKRKDYRLASIGYTLITGIYPTRDDIYNKLGLTYLYLKEYKKAYLAFITASKIRPYPHYFGNAGVAMWGLKKWKRAEFLLMKAINIAKAQGRSTANYYDNLIKVRKRIELKL